jgi:hypothetical protein
MARPLGDGRAGGIAFKATALSALAQGAIALDNEMAGLGESVRAAKNLSIDCQAAADTSPENHQSRHMRTRRSRRRASRLQLGEKCSVCILNNRHSDTKSCLQFFTQGYVAPREVGCC